MMPQAQPLRILLAGDPAPADVRVHLETAGYAVRPPGLAGIAPAEVARSQAVLIAVSAKVLSTAQALCRRWRIELGEHYVPIVWLAADDVPATAGLDAGADTVVRPTAVPDHLVAQLKALLRIQHLHGRLASRAAEAQ